MKTLRVGVGLGCVLGLAGCLTQFYGAPRVKAGPKGCESKCAAWGMELTGMVALGEYSDACICTKPTPPAPASPAATTAPSQAAAAAGAVVAVIEAQRAEQQRQNEQWQQQQGLRPGPFAPWP